MMPAFAASCNVSSLQAILSQGKAIDGKPFRREQVDGMNCFEAPSDVTLPACQEMVCRFQVCLQRYLADPVIRGANVSYKKPGMNVAQVCRSTLQRNRIFDGDISLLSDRSTLFTMLGSRR